MTTPSTQNTTPVGKRVPRPRLLREFVLFVAALLSIAALSHWVLYGWATEPVRTALVADSPPRKVLRNVLPILLLIAQIVQPQIGSISIVDLLARLLWFWRIARAHTAPTAYYEIQIPASAIGKGGGKGKGRTFIAKLIRCLTKRHGSRYPYLSLSFTGTANMPARVGVCVNAPRGQQQSLARRLETLLASVVSGARVIQCADPLRDRIPDGAEIVWRDYALALSPWYPLQRVGEETNDILADLLQAIAPQQGVDRVHAELIMQRDPKPTSRTRGWRAFGTGKLNTAAPRDVHANETDVKTLDRKLADDSCLVTVRVTLIAATFADAHAQLHGIDQSISTYRATTLGVTQAFVPDHAYDVRVPAPGSQPAGQPFLHALITGLIAGALTFGVQPLTALSRMAHVAVLPMVTAHVISLFAMALPALVAIAAVLGFIALHPARRVVRANQRWQRVLHRVPGVPSADGILLWFDRYQAAPLTAAELAPFAAFIDTTHAVDYLTWQPYPAPAHAFTNNNPKRVSIGLGQRSDGSLAPVGPTWRDLRQIGHLTAGMGAGKSRTLAHIGQQAIHIGFVCIDGKGDDAGGSLVSYLRRLIPLADEHRLVILDVLDADHPIGINILAGVDRSRPGWETLIMSRVRALMRSIEQSWTGQMETLLDRVTLLVVAGDDHPTLATIKQALIDPAKRAAMIRRVTDIEAQRYWQSVDEDDGMFRRTRDALVRRLDALLANPLTRSLVAQAAPEFSFAEAMEEQLIVLIPLPDQTLGPLASTVGTLVMQAFVQAAFARPGTSETRDDYPLIVDELYVLIANSQISDMETALTRLRSLGIPTLYAHQALQQLGALEDLMRINAASRIILQTREPDASAIARQYVTEDLNAADIAGQQPTEHQYAQLLCDNRATPVFSLVPPSWPTPVAADPPADTGEDYRLAMPDGRWEPWEHEVIDWIKQVRWPECYNLQPIATGAMVEFLAALPDDQWQTIRRLWRVVQLAERAALLRNPASIPDRIERQTTLSRLLVSPGRLMVEAEYRRNYGAASATAPSNDIPDLDEDTDDLI